MAKFGKGKDKLTLSARVKTKDPLSYAIATDCAEVAFGMINRDFYSTPIRKLIRAYEYLLDSNTMLGLPVEELKASIDMFKNMRSFYGLDRAEDAVYSFATRKIDSCFVRSWIDSGALSGEFRDSVVKGYPELAPKLEMKLKTQLARVYDN